jgi:hypothetical protein
MNGFIYSNSALHSRWAPWSLPPRNSGASHGVEPAPVVFRDNLMVFLSTQNHLLRSWPKKKEENEETNKKSTWRTWYEHITQRTGHFFAVQSCHASCARRFKRSSWTEGCNDGKRHSLGRNGGFSHPNRDSPKWGIPIWMAKSSVSS